jgi:hypothetical protein
MMRVRDIAVTAVTAISVTVASAWAGDDLRHDGPNFLLFSTTDLWRHGGFLHGGMVWSPNGLDHSGIAVKLMLGGGMYRYISGALGNTEIAGRLHTAAILPGWRFVQGKFIATVYAGLDWQNHRLEPDDFSASLRGPYVGLRGNVELWHEPYETMMIATDASISTIGASYNARLAFGWLVTDGYYLGPEVQAFAAGGNYRQFRTGIHFTGLRSAMVEWSGSAGWAMDSDERNGLYGRLSLLARR